MNWRERPIVISRMLASRMQDAVLQEAVPTGHLDRAGAGRAGAAGLVDRQAIADRAVPDPAAMDGVGRQRAIAGAAVDAPMLRPRADAIDHQAVRTRRRAMGLLRRHPPERADRQRLAARDLLARHHVAV